jgi:hypothetical protein
MSEGWRRIRADSDERSESVEAWDGFGNWIDGMMY